MRACVRKNIAKNYIQRIKQIRKSLTAKGIIKGDGAEEEQNENENTKYGGAAYVQRLLRNKTFSQSQAKVRCVK